MRRSLAVLAALSLGLACACAPTVGVPPKADLPAGVVGNQELNEELAVLAAQAAAAGDYRIGAEDLLELTLFDIEDGDGAPRIVSGRVSNTGYVTLPYVGNVKAADKTPQEFENHLRAEYRRFIHDPQLTVFIREYRSYQISVVGYVKEPGVIELRGRRTLLEALAMCGGLTDDAGKNVRLMRMTADGRQTVLIDLDHIAEGSDLSLNVALLPGDLVTVPRAGTFYVEGVVKKPGAYPLLQETTVSQAVATAGGPDDSIAKISGTVLYRRAADGDRVAIPIDLAALQRGDEHDFAIQEDDVIVVPVSGPRLWIDRFTRGVLRIGLSAPLL